MKDELRRTLADTTSEQRRSMSAAELITLMGEKHVGHPAYKPRPVPLIPMPNLAGRQPVISKTEYGVMAEFRRLLRWAAQ